MTSYFKDIYGYLSNLYPNHKVYVISDHHFYHENILKYSRSNFTSLNEMHDYIIQKHNSVVQKEDIVIFLGDFCFKNSETLNMVNSLNGHKFLILGNHEDENMIKHYKEKGFENVYLYPVKFQNNILSHYPILNPESNDVIYQILKKEFTNSKEVNFHGHEHNMQNTYERSHNVACENINYTPRLIGYTEGKLNYKDSPFIINSERFNYLIDFFVKERKMNENLLLKDFLYTMILEVLTNENQRIFFNGSYTLYKKYGYIANFSDLDGTLLYDDMKSKKQNNAYFKEVIDSVYQALKDFECFNVGFDKRMPNINILSILYSDGYKRFEKTYLDLNMLKDNYYLPSDFITFEDNSTIEKMCNRYIPSITKEYLFPKYKVNFLNTNGDIANLLLQYFFQEGFDYKKGVVKSKLGYILRTMSPNNKQDLENIDDYLVRFLARNIAFLSSTHRNEEIQNIANRNLDLNIFNQNMPLYFAEKVLNILQNGDFALFLRDIQNKNVKYITSYAKEVGISKTLKK